MTSCFSFISFNFYSSDISLHLLFIIEPLNSKIFIHPHIWLQWQLFMKVYNYFFSTPSRYYCINSFENKWVNIIKKYHRTCLSSPSSPAAGNLDCMLQDLVLSVARIWFNKPFLSENKIPQRHWFLCLLHST